MTYWRMQLHPDSHHDAVKHTIESLAARYIGLDFANDVGDLTKADKNELPANQKDCWAFAHEMKEDDLVLAIAHHFPFALAKVTGGYNYIRQVAPEIGVWFRHFRPVASIRYYADFKTNARSWEQIKMTDTISPLRDPQTLSYRLIEEWSLAHRREVLLVQVLGARHLDPNTDLFPPPSIGFSVGLPANVISHPLNADHGI